jgi:hypothetical protein
MQTLNLVIAFCALLLGGLCFIFATAYWLVLARHFDRYFPDFVKTKESFESGFWFMNPVLRGARYAGLMIFKKAWKRPYNQYFFGDFNFRQHARRIDWFVVIGSQTCLIIMVLLAAILFVANGFHWPSA